MFEVTVNFGSKCETMTFKGESLQDILTQVTQVTSAGALLDDGYEEDCACAEDCAYAEDLEDMYDSEGCECCDNFTDLMDTLYGKLHTAAELDNLQAVDVYSKAIQRMLATV